TALVITFLLSACGGDETNSVDNDQQSADEQINVVTSFTIIEDMVEQIGGDYVNVYNLVPTGTDPHEYEPLPEDIMEATDADVRSEEHTSELQSRFDLVCRLLLEKK